MDITIFYAWESDRPDKVNQYLIRDAAREACERISEDETNDWNLILDSDTKGVAGMCDIPNTILKKIRKCDIFLGDLTIVGKSEGTSPKLLPNTNVVIELGYAARHLGFSALVGVMNEAFGKVEGQVFDIKRRDCLRYSLSLDATKEQRDKARKVLGKQLEEVFRVTIEQVVIPRQTLRKSVVQVQAPKPPLRPAAKRLLLEAAADPYGKISVTQDSLAFCIQTNGREFVGSHDPKLWTTWKGAVDELEKLEYVTNLGGHGQIFELKDIGFERAADLKENDPVHSLTAEAQQLLIEAADDDGVIIFAKNEEGPGILVAGQEFTKHGDAEESAKWIHGFKQLHERHFIENDGEESVFRLQKVGFDAAKELKFQPQ